MAFVLACILWLIQETVFGQYKCDYVVHGDDPCIVDSKDVFASAKVAP